MGSVSWTVFSDMLFLGDVDGFYKKNMMKIAHVFICFENIAYDTIFLEIP